MKLIRLITNYLITLLIPLWGLPAAIFIIIRDWSHGTKPQFKDGSEWFWE